MNITSMQNPDTVAVIGGGAAGMMAAGALAAAGASVTLFEQNSRPGCKLAITGKGRCNLTNDCSPAEFLQNVTKNPRFLYSAINGFSPADTMALFESLGVPLKTERGRRVFPVSDRARDIVDALLRYCRGARLLRERVLSVTCDGGRVTGVATTVARYPASAVILATGGCSYPRTGSDGNGYAIAAALGHTVTPLIASLVPIESRDPLCAAMQGLSLKNVSLRITGENGRVLYEDFGEMLFTHFGVSGPMILSASAHLRACRGKCTAHIDLKPALDEKTLDHRLLSDIEAGANRTLSHILGGLLPALMIPVCLQKTEIPPDRRGHDLTREERHRLLRFLKDLSFPLSGFRPIEEAVVTSGGIDVREVDPGSMMSRLVPGLYFTGEILDVDAYTGGYNLQIAFSTAQAAARAIWKAERPKHDTDCVPPHAHTIK